jgi:hypothetical protein
MPVRIERQFDGAFAKAGWTLDALPTVVADTCRLVRPVFRQAGGTGNLPPG